mmetsp:Transcript_24067/g.56776  ORF Transcript_24067/g.56776 Transcript_24067/m.56776 type:complete len:468 (+) Transcript_24067:381-1784(+)
MTKQRASGTIPFFCLLLPAIIIAVDAAPTGGGSKPPLIDLPGRIATGIRRRINLNGLLGSPTRPTNSESGSPYDKIMGHPVFQVTTAWGSSYMNMEKLSMDEVESQAAADGRESTKMLASGLDEASSFGAEDSQYRTISLYYMDPNDAIGAHAEFKQMDGMADSDVRICSVSLAKALRSATHLGRGLLTGQPIDNHKGTILPPKEGGTLRHKIMPSKKQLFYAARCHGRERVGLFGKGGDDDDRDGRYEQAVSAVIGNSALAYRNMQRKQAIRDRKIAYKPKNDLEAEYAHMDGHLAIPVFYAPGMERLKSRAKALVSGSKRKETPFFFNYEDLQAAWQKTRPLSKDKDVYLPDQPPMVEVFNLWDVLVSMDKEQTLREQKIGNLSPKDKILQGLTHPFLRRWSNVVGGRGGAAIVEDTQLDGIVFVPSSDASTYKESITARGDGKVRARPMRQVAVKPWDRKVLFF